MLLTRREVKMAGYWPRFFFAVLLSSTYSSRSMNVKLYDKITIICNWPSLFGQDDWILAKFLFCVLWPQKRTELICRHLDWTSLVNYKGFIVRSKRLNSLSLAQPTRETPGGQDTIIVTARKTTQAPFMWRRVRSIALQAVPTSASVYMRKTLTFLP